MRPVRSVAVATLATVTAIGAVMSFERVSRDRGQAPPLVPVAGAEAATGPDCVGGATLQERAAMTLVVGLPGVTDADDPVVDLVARIGVGGVMLRDENLISRRQAAEMVDGLRDRLGDHLLVAVDEEGGRVTSLRALGDSTPSARRLGRSGATAAREAGAELGELARSIGIDWIFAPVLDLDAGPAGGVIGDRSFGDDPEEVAALAGAFADGLRSAGLAITLKHFPGHGATDDDPHAGAAVDHRTRRQLLAKDIRPFDELVDDGAEAVMVGHVTYPRVWGTFPASLTPDAYELLRARGFDGVAVTDAMGMGAVYNRWGFGAGPARALAAGADAVLVNQGDRVLELRDGIVLAVLGGRLAETRVDEAVARVLALRGQDPAGILCQPAGSAPPGD